MAGANLSAGQAAEVIAAEGLSAQSADAGTWPDATRSHEEPADPGETHAAFAEALDWSPVAEAMPEEVEALARGRDHLDPFVLDTRMRALVRVQHQVGWQTGRLLRVLADRRLYLLMGFPSLARYLRERLGMSERRARALVALERHSWQAPALGIAYRAGDLSWVQALTVLPVATDETAAAWVERAQQVTVRRLADEVEWALAGCVPRGPVSPPPPHASLETIDERERQTCALGDDEWTGTEIAFSAPASVVALFRTAILAFTRRGEPLWKGLGQLLDHVRAEWSAQPRHRDPVFERDGWRCRVPGCSARRNLHDHHIVFRSQGGANGRANRTTICVAHHLRGIHAGYVRAWGTAPDEITWELGVRPGREPLLRLKGDWYLS
jgi:hypothetical protein